MLQKKTPSDSVLATGNQYSVKKFIELSLDELKIKYRWKGKGINIKCYDEKGNCIVSCKKEYYRPLEVDSLLGNSQKARKELRWKPKTNIKSLVKEMINFELKNL